MINHENAAQQILSVLGQQVPGQITVLKNGNHILIQNAVNSQIYVTQNINNIDEATFLKQIISKIISQYPLRSTKNIPKELNTIWAAPPRTIIGRVNEIQEILERLLKDNSLLLVSGIGGIGKTVVASYYYTIYHKVYHHVLWLDGQRNLEEAILFDYSLHESLGVSEKLKPLLSTIQDPKKHAKRKRALAIIETELKRLIPRTLVIIDNSTAENFKIIQKWQATFTQFHFLITSRETNTNLNTMRLDVLSEEEAKNLFYTHYHFEKDDELVAKILQLISFHTLLIELVAKAGEEGSIELQKLLEFLQTGFIEHEGLQYNIDINEIQAERMPDEQQIVAYIQLLFKTILQLNPEEQQILSSLSVLPTQPHKKVILMDLLKNTKKKSR